VCRRWAGLARRQSSRPFTLWPRTSGYHVCLHRHPDFMPHSSRLLMNQLARSTYATCTCISSIAHACTVHKIYSIASLTWVLFLLPMLHQLFTLMVICVWSMTMRTS
jgi:hypothetical protein